MRTTLIIGALALSTLTGCAGLSERDQRIGSGAIIGGVLGNVVGGSGAATVGGAIVGGVVGAQVDNDAKARERDWQRADWQRRYDECRRYYSQRYCDRNVR